MRKRCCFLSLQHNNFIFRGLAVVMKSPDTTTIIINSPVLSLSWRGMEMAHAHMCYVFSIGNIRVN